MNFYPAIDLKEGQCVRLQRGDLDTAIVYNDNPIAQAKIFQEAGCHWLHVVDLDGAVSGSKKNVKTIEEIRSSTSLKIQVGGGIRNLKEIEFWKSKGIDRVILGTLAVSNPSIVQEACRIFDGIFFLFKTSLTRVLHFCGHP